MVVISTGGSLGKEVVFDIAQPAEGGAARVHVFRAHQEVKVIHGAQEWIGVQQPTEHRAFKENRPFHPTLLEGGHQLVSLPKRPET